MEKMQYWKIPKTMPLEKMMYQCGFVVEKDKSVLAQDGKLTHLGRFEGDTFIFDFMQGLHDSFHAENAPLFRRDRVMDEYAYLVDGTGARVVDLLTGMMIENGYSVRSDLVR